MGFITLSPMVPASGSVALGSSIVDLAVTNASIVSLVVTGSHSVAGVSQFSAASFSGNVRVATPAVVDLAVGTAALSSDNAVALLPSNSVRMVAVGTVLQFYFNQTGTAVYRATLNLGTF